MTDIKESRPIAKPVGLFLLRLEKKQKFTIGELQNGRKVLYLSFYRTFCAG